MGKHSNIGFVTGLTFLGAAAFSAATVPAVAGQRIHAPLGYQLMCLQTPAECEGGGASVEKGSDSQMALLKQINIEVNSSIRPTNDAPGTDVWSVDVTAGDCEDYALTKRHALIKAGFDPSALRLAYTTASGIGHAILVVKTSHGDFVLDNLSNKVRTVEQSGYHIISEASANPEQWT